MWTALALGFFGSLHCIAMCGPLLLALPITGSKLPAWRLGIYHFGRLCSYVLLGILMGLLGKGTSIAGLHQSIALFVGSGLVLSGILQLFFNTRRYPTSLFRLYGNLHRRLIQSLGVHPLRTFFGLGMVNGILPCGLVYVALTAAFVMSSPFQSMGYMFLFGLGTLPAVFSVQALQYALKKIRLEQKINYLIPLLSILLGLWIMLRGANLSIPFISPTSTKLELKPNTE